MPKLDLSSAVQIKDINGEIVALKGSGFSWTLPVVVAGEYITTLATGYASVGNIIENVSATSSPSLFGYGPKLSGKVYWELDRGATSPGNATDSYPGVYSVDEAADNYDVSTTGTGTVHPSGLGRRTIGFVYNNGSLSTGHDTWNGLADNEVLMFAYDEVAEKLWIGTNGVWQDDPSAGTGGFDVSWSTAIGGLCVAINCRQVGVSFELKTKSVDLDYTIPTGFSALT